MGGGSSELLTRISELENAVSGLLDRVESVEQSRAGVEEYGLTKISDSSTITESAGIALSASQNNQSIPNTLAARIAQAQNELLKIEQDSGWKELSLINGFSAYSSSQRPRYRKIWKTVEICGAVTGESNGTADTVFCNIPSDIRPASEIRIRCQGSGQNTWLFVINSAGQLIAGRYGNGVNSTGFTNGTWLPFHVTYTV